MTERDPTPFTGNWRGQPNYQCRLCAFSTPEEQKFIDHFALSHPPLEIIDGGKAGEPDGDPPAQEPAPTPVLEAKRPARRRGRT